MSLPDPPCGDPPRAPSLLRRFLPKTGYHGKGYAAVTHGRCVTDGAAHASLWAHTRYARRRQVTADGRRQDGAMMKRSKEAGSWSYASSGSTCATNWSGRATTMQPAWRSMPRLAKISWPP